MSLFLHEKGYTYFTIPNLTYYEINEIVDAAGRRVKKQEQAQKKMEMKARAKKGIRRYR